MMAAFGPILSLIHANMVPPVPRGVLSPDGFSRRCRADVRGARPNQGFDVGTGVVERSRGTLPDSSNTLTLCRELIF